MFILFISVATSKIILLGFYDVLGINRSNEKIVLLEVPENAGLLEISDLLEKHGIIKYKYFFIAYGLLRKFPKYTNVVSFEMKTNLDYEAIVRKFKTGNVESREVVEITFIEGMTAFDYANLLEKYEVCSKKDFLSVCNDEKIFSGFEILQNLNINKNKCILTEGYLFPDTYKFYKKDNAKDVVRKMMSNFVKKITKDNDFNGNGQEISLVRLLNENQSALGLEKIMTIASMISAEAANKDDMFMVSSIIHNRLDTIKNGGVNRYGEYGMNVLRIDATVNYPNNGKNTQNNAYNTYKIIGLPPGAICNPGIDAILAAICPKSTNYFYYCHSKSGTPFYAQTNDVHIKNRSRAGLD